MADPINSDQYQSKTTKPYVLLLIFPLTLIIVIYTKQYLSKWGIFIPQKELTGNVLDSIGVFFIISIFVERMVGLFLSYFRSNKADEDDFDISVIQNELGEETDQTRKKQLRNDLNDRLRNRLAYKTDSRKLAIVLSLTFGLLISVSGMSFLFVLFGSEAFDKLNHEFNQHLFVRFIDIFLTASIIGGGTAGMNRILEKIKTLIPKR